MGDPQYGNGCQNAPIRPGSDLRYHRIWMPLVAPSQGITSSSFIWLQLLGQNLAARYLQTNIFTMFTSTILAYGSLVHGAPLIRPMARPQDRIRDVASLPSRAQACRTHRKCRFERQRNLAKYGQPLLKELPDNSEFAGTCKPESESECRAFSERNNLFQFGSPARRSHQSALRT